MNVNDILIRNDSKWAIGISKIKLIKENDHSWTVNVLDDDYKTTGCNISKESIISYFMAAE